MLSELQRRKVWESWLADEIRANYFADLAARYYRIQRTTTWLILALSSGAFVTLATKVLPEYLSWVAPALAFVTAALSLYSLVAQNQKNAIESADLHLRWNALAHDYARLWNDMYAEDASARLAAFEQREVEASKTSTAFEYDERRMLKWQEYVEQHHAARTAA